MKKTALVVEDDPNWQDDFRLALSRKGFEILQASDLKEAKELFLANSEEIGLVVMDGCLGSNSPNSMDLIKNIRQTFNGPMIASSGSKLYLKELTGAGCNFMFHKGGIGYFDELLEAILK